MPHPVRPPGAAEYRTLAEFRLALRQYLAFAEAAAQEAGIPPRQYQALLIIKAQRAAEAMTVGLLAGQLLIAPQTALELVNRLESAGLVRIVRDRADRRRRLLALTPVSEALLAQLSEVHMRELRELAPNLIRLLKRLAT